MLAAASALTAHSLGAAQVPGTAALVAKAVALEHGEGVPRDASKAAELYCEAARDGDVDALYGLGWMVANGRGVPRDDATAAALFAQAAERGHEQARNVLARLGTPPGALPACMTRAVVTAPSGAPAADTADGASGSPLVDPFAGLPPRKRRIADLVKKVAPRYAVDPALALAVIATESNFEPQARSAKDARGLMQLVPETAARFNVRDAFDVHENVRGGLTYLRWLLSYYRGEVALVAAAYNAGEGTVDRYRGVPPFPETRDYVQRVLSLFRRSWHPYDSRVAAEPSKAAARPGPRSGPVRGTFAVGASRR